MLKTMSVITAISARHSKSCIFMHSQLMALVMLCARHDSDMRAPGNGVCTAIDNSCKTCNVDADAAEDALILAAAVAIGCWL
jgi:hypothetical protein